MDESEHELVLTGARIYDGSGRPPFAADVGVTGGRISAVAPAIRGRSDNRVNLGGLALAPGFIDAHTHDDRAVLDQPHMTAKVSQGVTTVVTGNCGISLAPLIPGGDLPAPMNLLGAASDYRFPTMASYAEALKSSPPAVNVVALVGHMSLRLDSMSDISKPAVGDEIAAMRSALSKCMQEGASGLSTGLFYSPNAAADRNEVTAVASVLAEHSGIYTTHMRCEGDRVLESIEESAETAKQSGVPLLISHHKCTGRANWGRSAATLRRIAELRRSQSIHVDVYPYAAGSTILTVPQVSDDVRIIVTWSEKHPELSGRDLSQIAADWGISCKEAAAELTPAGAIYFQMDEADVERIMSAEFAVIGSDGLPHDRHPHPRLWGTFPRAVGRCSREAGWFSVAEAVHKSTGLTAKVFGLEDRGRIGTGYAADLVVFDEGKIIDRATYQSPKIPSSGIHSVYVNGAETFSSGRVTGRSGRLLRGRPKS